MGAIFNPPKPKSPEPVKPPPSNDNAEVEAARRAEVEEQARKTKRRGRATLLTGGEGVTEAPNVQRKSLLGQ